MIDPAVAGLAGAVCCGVAIRGVVMVRGASSVERRELSDELTDRGHRRGIVRQLVDLLGGRFGPMVLDRMTPNRRRAVTHRLDRAGRPGGMGIERYAEVRAAILVIAVAFAVWFALLGAWVMVPLLLAVGLLAVDFWLSRIGRRRQDRIERDIPDLIDILSVTVRAGAGYRIALERVALALEGPASEEVLLTLHQMELGASRREAFEALRERNDSATLDSFVGAQLQAEELGVPLADALQSIAADTRAAAAQNARRRAQRTAPRVSLITAVLLLPATMLLIVVGMYIGEAGKIGHIL